MQELISIIVPIYKVEKYLNKCIESILNQTYSNLEIILIDDGSPDKCGEICDFYKNKDSRIKVIHKKNEGVSKARNIGLDISKGKYIMFVDSDDYIDKNMIKELRKLITEQSADIAIGGVIDVDENNNQINMSKKRTTFTFNQLEAIRELLDENYFNSVCWGKLYKANLWKNKRFCENSKIGEDLEILYEVFEKIQKVVINTEKCYYYYTVRQNSVTHQEYNEKWKKAIEICRNIKERTEKKYPKIVDSAIKKYVNINIKCIQLIAKNSTNKSEMEKLKKNIRPYFWKYLKNKKIIKKMKIKLIIIFVCPPILKFK